MRLSIEAYADTGLLCRMLACFAQSDIAPPDMTVETVCGVMTVELTLATVNPSEGVAIAERIARCIGVTRILVDGTAPDGFAGALRRHALSGSAGGGVPRLMLATSHG